MKNFLFTGSIFMLLSLFVGCGSDSSSTAVEASSTNLSGTVAVGVGAPARVTFIGANAQVAEGYSTENGEYSIATTGLTSPIIVRAILNADGNILYSFASSANGTANVTPLTSYVVDDAAVASGQIGGASQLFTAFRNRSVPSTIANYISARSTSLSTLLSSIMSEYGVSNFNHFSDRFSANHTGYDALLDALDIEMSGDDVIIRTGAQVLNTLNYPIVATDINISGNVYNISDESVIPEANITLTDRADQNVTVTTDVNGSFKIEVNTMRVYDVTIEADGYITQRMPNVPAFAVTEINLGSIPMYLVSEAASTTDLSGLVFDARTQDTALAGAILKFRTGYGERLATPVATATADTDGMYAIDELPIGTYTVEVSRANYNTQYVVVHVYGLNMTSDFSLLSDAGTSTIATGAFATIVLNWGANPSDLDSHLTGPSTEGTRFHMYYANPVIGTGNSNTCENNIAVLDRDDVTAYGPETTSLCTVEAGAVYKYYIHHYSGTETISTSGATVTVTTIYGVSQTYTAPSGATGVRDIWHVFNIDSYGNITPVNSIIGNDVANGPVFAVSSRVSDMSYASEITLFDNLPSK